MLQVDNLHFTHPGAPPLLEQVSFTLNRGSTLCLLGPNGSGKTTLMRCILGLEKPGSGRVSIDGRDIAALSPVQRARQMAYVPQSSTGAFPFTVFDVVLMGRSAYLRFMSDPGEADHQAARDALARLQIQDLESRLFHQLSGGERQLVLLARAVAQRSPLLVMDEPCTGLDLGHQVQVLQAMRSLAAEGYAILMSTHLPENAFALDAQVALLAHRRLRGPAPASELLTAAELSRLYGTAVDLLQVPSGPARGQRVCVPVLTTIDEGIAHAPAPTTAGHVARERDNLVSAGR